MSPKAPGAQEQVHPRVGRRARPSSSLHRYIAYHDRPVQQLKFFFAQLLSFAIAIAAAHMAGNALYLFGTRVALAWPASGLLIATLLLSARRYWAHFCLVALMIGLSSDIIVHDRPVSMAVAFGLANVSEGLLAAALFRKFRKERPNLTRIGATMTLILVVCLIATPFSALIGATTLCLSIASLNPVSTFQIWWFSDVMGALLVAPPLLSLLGERSGSSKASSLELGALLGASAFVACLVFLRPVQQHLPFLSASFLFAPALWGGLRLGQKGATLSTLVMASVVLGSAAWGYLPVDSGRTPTEIVLRLQGFLVMLAIGSVVVVAVGEERRAAMRHRHDTQLQLERAQRLQSVGQLAAGIAHDFNNILMLILASADFVREQQGGKNQEVKEMMTEVVSACERGASLTRQLLLFGKNEPVELSAIEINETLRHLEKLLRRVLIEDIKLELVLDPSEPHLVGDPLRIEQAVLNLAVNARDAMPRGGRLKIETRLSADKRKVEIVVEDNGTGMSETVQQSLFQPFFTTKSEGKGTGLGLVIVRSVIEELGGSLTFRSELGVGTTFVLKLPSAQASGSDTRPSIVSSSTNQSQARVLLCDDDTPIRQVVTRILEHVGHDVIAFSSGENAIAFIETANRIDLLLTDVVMSGASGVDVAQALHDRFPETPRIFMSGYTGGMLKERNVGESDELLHKPFSPEQLRAAVSRVLDRRLSRESAG